MAQLRSHHVKRQVNDDPNSPGYCPDWWYCDEKAYIIKWAVIGAIVFLLLAFMLIGYYHAKKRMARGLPPLRYHRWLLSRRSRERWYAQHQPQNPYGGYRPSGGYGQPQAYPMNNYGYAAPPPAYHEAENVPVYTPPSKVNPDQSYDVPPSGPPPAEYNAHAGSSNLNVPGPSMPQRAVSPYQNYNHNNK